MLADIGTSTTAYVRNGPYADDNFGSATDLQVKLSPNGGYTRQSYLRFDLSAVTGGAASSVKLRLYGRLDKTSSTGVTVNVQRSPSTTWGETSVTWDTRPATGGTVYGSTTVSGTVGRWYEVDVTTLVNEELLAGRKVLTVALVAPNRSDPFVTFASDDAASNRPHLAVTPGPGLAALQQAFLAKRYGMFIHFSYETFTNSDLSVSDDVDRFDPSGVDTDQWAAVAKNAGMTYGVLTTKHHTGFALWDSSRTTFDVAATDWYRDEVAAGRSGDVVKRYADSFREAGLGVGLYYSVWDRHLGLDADADPAWATNHVKAELTELLTKYGPIQQVWTDGWGWKVGYDAVDWQAVYDHMKKVSPGTLLIENNHEFNLAHSDIVEYERPVKWNIPSGNKLPSEVSDTIRADGTWHYRTWDPSLRSTAFLVDNGKQANGRLGNYLLNVGPDRSGRIPAKEVARLQEVQRAWFGANLAAGRPARQSTTYVGGDGRSLSAGYATDGKLQGFASSAGTVARTQSGESAPWWEVDLQSERRLRRVHLFNRTDAEQNRLRDLTIRVYDADRKLVYTSPTINAGNAMASPQTIYHTIAAADGVVGRYVRITRTVVPGTSGALNLAEVQIFAP